MKTQIISLEPHDDLISVRDKLAWAKTPRILLVWPLRGRVELRPLDLKLLQRHAGGLGAQLGLVTRSEEMIQTAQALGLPVFKSASEAQRASWPAPCLSNLPPRRAPKTNLRARREQMRIQEAGWLVHPAVRLGFFALGVLAALSIGSLFIPRAEIHIPLASQTQSVDLPVSAGPDIQAASLSGSLPAYVVSQTLEGSQITPASGNITLPQSKTRGTVTFRNLTPEPVHLPAGTLLETLDSPPIRFQTLQAGDVPAGVEGTLELPVEALLPGKSGNVPANALRALAGAPGLSLAVSNAAALTGGADLTVRGPSQSDRQRAYELLLANLTRQAEAALRQEAGGGLLLSNTIRADVLAEAYTPPAGQPGADVAVSLKVVFTADAVRRADLERVGTSVLDAALEPDQAAAPGMLAWEMLSDPVTASDGLSRFQLRLSRTVWRPVQAAQVIQLVQGRPPGSAVQRLEQELELAGRPEIRLSPSWWPWLPLVSMRTQVVFEFP